MSVYYVVAPDLNLVKIGFALHPEFRMSKLRSDSPVKLVLYCVEEGDKTLEAERHREFANFRVNGEWFAFQGKLRGFINGLPRFVETKKRKALRGPLGEWIVRKGHTLESFAELAGTTQATLSRICDGKQFPRRDLMLAIIKATDWEVDANALLEIPAKPRAGIEGRAA